MYEVVTIQMHVACRFSLGFWMCLYVSLSFIVFLSMGKALWVGEDGDHHLFDIVGSSILHCEVLTC